MLKLTKKDKVKSSIINNNIIILSRNKFSYIFTLYDKTKVNN